MDMVKLSARFRLDDHGRPRFIEDAHRRHYQIRLAVKDPPDGAVSVTYQLDPTYWDRVREAARGKDGDFAEYITSYGDYEVQASISGSRLAGRPTSALLSRMLRDGHASDEGDRDAIDGAIRYIQEH